MNTTKHASPVIFHIDNPVIAGVYELVWIWAMKYFDFPVYASVRNPYAWFDGVVFEKILSN